MVESYDQSSKTLTGSFELDLVPEAQNGKNIEYVLRITEGRFKGTLTEVP